MVFDSGFSAKVLKFNYYLLLVLHSSEELCKLENHLIIIVVLLQLIPHFAKALAFAVIMNYLQVLIHFFELKSFIKFVLIGLEKYFVYFDVDCAVEYPCFERS